MQLSSLANVRSASSTAAILLLSTAIGCDGDRNADENQQLGQAVIALTSVPSSGRCVEVTIQSPRLTVTKRFDVGPGQPAVVTMDGLPLGPDVFTESVFSAECASANDTTLAWISDPVTVTVGAGAPVHVLLSLHAATGRAVVTADFPDQGAIVTRFPLAAGANPYGITAGPDGALWFTERGAVGRITVDGVITTFPVGPSENQAPPFGITAGTDGRIWFLESGPGRVGRLDPTTGELREFIVPAADEAREITNGRDGNLWFAATNFNEIVRVTPDGVFTEFFINTWNARPIGITSDTDGNIWFTEPQANQIGRLTLDGVVTEFPIPTPNSSPYGITAGPDGALWFAENGANKIGRVTLDGAMTEISIQPGVAPQPFQAPPLLPLAITTGPDGNIWFTVYNSDPGLVGRIKLNGELTTFRLPAPGPTAFSITGGPDGAIWLIEALGNAIDRIVPPAR